MIRFDASRSSSIATVIKWTIVFLAYVVITFTFTTMARILVTTSIILTALSTLVPADIPTGSNGYSLVWGDDFNGDPYTAIDSNNWQFDLGTGYPGGAANWGTGEVETYTNDIENCYQDGSGNLRIVPLKDGSGSWTSARIESVKDDFMAPPGGIMAVEAKIQIPKVSGDGAAGYFPAFWMLGTPFRNNYEDWPGVGEFDIMENVNGINKVFGTLHCGVLQSKLPLMEYRDETSARS